MAGASEAGQVRSVNQDAFYVGAIGNDRMLAIVADGMGGHRAGEVASRQAVKVIREQLEPPHTHLPTAIARAVQEANDEVYGYAQQSPEYRGMGTTVTLVLIDDSVALIGHVGDSRAYRVRDSEIRQLTHDHTWVAEQLQRGILSPEEAKGHRWRNVITNALGATPTFRLELSHIELQAGDRLLLCSDGVSGLLSAATMRQIVSDHPPSDAVHQLLELADERGSPDNITAVVLGVEQVAPRRQDYRLPPPSTVTDTEEPLSLQLGDSNDFAPLQERYPEVHSFARWQRYLWNRYRFWLLAGLYLTLVLLLLNIV